MHNFLLGSAKHNMMNIWNELKLITDNHLEAIQEKVDNFCTRKDVRRIPTKISSWIFRIQVRAVTKLDHILAVFTQGYLATFALQLLWKLCQCKITTREINEAFMLLNKYCWAFENVCLWQGTLQHKSPPPWTHAWMFKRLWAIVCILIVCIWTTQRSFHTNWHDLSLHVMQRYLRSKEFQLQTFANEYKDLSPLIDKCIYNGLSNMHVSKAAIQDSTCVHPLPPVRELALTLEQRQCICSRICRDYPDSRRHRNFRTF